MEIIFKYTWKYTHMLMLLYYQNLQQISESIE